MEEGHTPARSSMGRFEWMPVGPTVLVRGKVRDAGAVWREGVAMEVG